MGMAETTIPKEIESKLTLMDARMMTESPTLMVTESSKMRATAALRRIQRMSVMSTKMHLELPTVTRKAFASKKN